jgi:hypothetical protein
MQPPSAEDDPPIHIHSATASPDPNALMSRALPLLYVAAYIASCVFTYATIAPLAPWPTGAAAAAATLDPLALLLQVSNMGAAGAYLNGACHELLHSKHPIHRLGAWAGEAFAWHAAYVRSHMYHHLVSKFKRQIDTSH